MRTTKVLLRNYSLHSTLAVQALGSLATLLLGLLIAWFQGPQAQGHYGVVRSTADLLLAIALLGLPQGVVHLLNHERIRPQALYAALSRYVCGVALLGLIMAASRVSGVLPGGLREPEVMLALAAGVTGWVVHGLQRAFVLCLGSTAAFSWLTAAPALTLLMASIVLLAAGSHRYEWALAASGAASALWGALLVARLRTQPGWHRGSKLRWQKLISFGGHSTVQTVSMALQPWLALWLLQHFGASPAELGWFVIAGYVLQVFVLPANFVTPLIMARASNAAGAGKSFDISRRLREVGMLALIGCLAAAAALPFSVPLVLGDAYRPAIGPCVWMAAAGPAVLIGRLATALLLGRGSFQAVTLLFVLRVGLTALGIWLAATGKLQPLDRVTAAAASWALAEVIIAACLAALARPFQAPNGGNRS